MQAAEKDDAVRQRLQRIRREAEAARLEYQCRVLRDGMAEAYRVLRRRGAHADERLARDLRRWAAAVRVLEQRVARATAALHSMTRDTASNQLA